MPNVEQSQMSKGSFTGTGDHTTDMMKKMQKYSGNDNKKVDKSSKEYQAM